MRSIRSRVTVVVAVGVLLAIWLPAVTLVLTVSPGAFGDAGFVHVLLGATVLLALASWLIGRLAARFAVLPLEHATSRLEAVATGQLAPGFAGGSLKEIEVLEAAVGEIVRISWERERRQATTVGALAHDVRSSLAAMAAVLEGRIEGFRDAERATLIASGGDDALLSEVRRMQAITGDLVTLMRSPAGVVRHETLDVAEAVMMVGNAVGIGTGAEIDVLVTRTFRRTAPVGLIERVVRNLVENAAKVARTTVKIEVLDGLIVISDDGPGFPLAALGAQDHVGRTRAYVATSVDHGVGFQIASRLAERCGGRVVLERSTQGGSTVLVYL